MILIIFLDDENHGFTSPPPPDFRVVPGTDRILELQFPRGGAST